MKIPVLKIRDANGNPVPINAIRGERGKSAYEQAKEGGYVGTEEDFISILNGLTNADDASHFTDYNNPHKVTKEQIGLGSVDNTSDMDKPVSTAQAEAINAHASNKDNPHEVTVSQIGAIPEKYYSSDDLNNELCKGGNKIIVCNYHSGTLNTPHKEGLTAYAHGMVITNAHTLQYGTQMCLPSGENALYLRRLNGSGVSPWVKVADNGQHLARIAIGTYKGTNTYGMSKPNTLTFDFVPLFVMVGKRGTTNINSGGTFIWINPGTTLNFINNGSSYWCYPSLSGTTFSWYSSQSASYQLNLSNYDYDYLAWG